MVRWHQVEADMTTQRRASAVDGVKGNGDGGGNRRSGRKPGEGDAERRGNMTSRRETAVDESRKGMADKVARHQVD